MECRLVGIVDEARAPAAMASLNSISGYSSRDIALEEVQMQPSFKVKPIILLYMYS